MDDALFWVFFFFFLMRRARRTAERFSQKEHVSWSLSSQPGAIHSIDMSLAACDRIHSFVHHGGVVAHG